MNAFRGRLSGEEQGQPGVSEKCRASVQPAQWIS